MNRRTINCLLAALAMLPLAATTALGQADFDAELKAVRDGWAIANYKTPEAQKEDAFKKLIDEAATLTGHYPKRAEALIWEGIVLSTYAGVTSPLSAMGPAKAARQKFEAALAIDENAMGGSAHTSLGTLYHKVPGFPIGFGSDKKARTHLEKALQISPDGIDQNYFYGEFLYDEGEYEKALPYLEKGLKAPPRPGREVADEGRRAELRALIAKTREEM